MLELREGLAEAEQWNELSRAAGLGGRERRVGKAGERARVNVQRRLADAIKRISEIDPELGHHLNATIRTGTYCSYSPDRAGRAR